MRKLPIALTATGVLLLLLASKSVFAKAKSSGFGGKVDPSLPVGKYKAALRNKVYSPEVLKEILSWDKNRILQEIDALILVEEHRAAIKGIIENETHGSWYPGTLAGYWNPKNLNEADKSTNSTAFGITQVTRSTFEYVATKYQMSWSHDDLWYPTYAILSGYYTLLAKGLGKKNLKTVLINYAGGKEAYATVVMNNMKDYA